MYLYKSCDGYYGRQGSAGLTEQKQTKLSKNSKIFFLGKVRKIFRIETGFTSTVRRVLLTSLVPKKFLLILKNEVGFEFDSSAAKKMDISSRNFSDLLSYCKLAGKFCSSAI